MRVWLAAVWLSFCGVEFARGQIYKWMDHQGNAHFTDDLSRIPLEFRPNVEAERATPPVPPSAPSDATASHLPNEATSPAAAPPKDLLGRGPGYWQQLAQHWDAQLQRHLQERQWLRLLYNNGRHLAGHTRDNSDRGKVYADSARLEQAIAEAERQIQEAETRLHTTLPLEASQLGANPEWPKLPVPTW